MRLHGGKIRQASRDFSFFLEKSSTSPPMKKISGAKGVTLLAIRLEVVAPLSTHVLGELLDFFFLGNAFCQWGKSVTSSKQGKPVREYFFLSFL